MIQSATSRCIKSSQTLSTPRCLLETLYRFCRIQTYGFCRIQTLQVQRQSHDCALQSCATCSTISQINLQLLHCLQTFINHSDYWHYWLFWRGFPQRRGWQKILHRYVFIVNSGATTWSTHKQHTVAFSSNCTKTILSRTKNSLRNSVPLLPTVKRRSRSPTILPNHAKPSISMYAIMPCDTTFTTAKSKSTTFPRHINLRISLPQRSKRSIRTSWLNTAFSVLRHLHVS